MRKWKSPLNSLLFLTKKLLTIAASSLMRRSNDLFIEKSLLRRSVYLWNFDLYFSLVWGHLVSALLLLNSRSFPNTVENPVEIAIQSEVYDDQREVWGWDPKECSDYEIIENPDHVDGYVKEKIKPGWSLAARTSNESEECANQK